MPPRADLHHRTGDGRIELQWRRGSLFSPSLCSCFPRSRICCNTCKEKKIKNPTDLLTDDLKILTMVSEPGLVCGSSAGKKDSSSDRKNKRKSISNRKRKEQKDSVRQTLTLGFEAGGTYPPFLYRRLLAMPGRRIAGAQHVEPPLAAGTPGRMRADANARRRQRQAR